MDVAPPPSDHPPSTSEAVASADASSTAEAAAIPTGEKQKSVQWRADLTSEAS
ncbi:hypothetical protein QJS04_geneDACA011945 [Acorus gramineus]|uniref:Uncharacterized protein n=1 Tax=Acorus gramineus TaxID=55184 RepID=A0AAV9AJT6_ACOGR|nr:hypothetical protein QJS04_geneDACA011945 [Acorus gramineus]